LFLKKSPKYIISIQTHELYDYVSKLNNEIPIDCDVSKIKVKDILNLDEDVIADTRSQFKKEKLGYLQRYSNWKILCRNIEKLCD
jgi:hypothetical protein